ncbi:MAG: hypothetical protein HZB29_08255 [Nitrospinae bacterium]|nr:hypothetical protein [Nitrospinota bacterium]
MEFDFTMSLIYAVPSWVFIGWLGVDFAITLKRGGEVFQAFAKTFTLLLLYFIALGLAWRIYAVAGAPVAFSSAPVALIAIALFIRHGGKWEVGASATGWAGYASIGLAALAVNVPTIWYVFHNGFSAIPHFFVQVDVPYHYFHAMALVDNDVPEDLSFAGKTLRYHYGFAMFSAIISRTFFVPAGTSFFIIGPILVRLWLLSSFILAAERFGAVEKRTIIPFTLAFACFVFHVNVNLANLPGIIHAAAVELKSSMSFGAMWGEVSARISNGFVFREDCCGGGTHGMWPQQANYGFPAVMFFTIYGLALRRWWFLAALPAGFIFMVKSQIFMVTAGAFGLTAAWFLFRRRDFIPLAAYAVAMSISTFLLLTRFNVPFGFDNPDTINIRFAPGQAVELGYYLAYFHKLNVFVFLAPAAFLAANALRRKRPEWKVNWGGFGFLAAAALTAYMVPMAMRFDTGPAFGKLLTQMHSAIGLKPAFLLDIFNWELMDATYGFLNTMGAFALSLLIYITYNRYGAILKAVAWSGAAFTAFLYMNFILVEPESYKKGIATDEIREVLSLADLSSVIITNQLAYPASDYPREFRNVLYPAIMGHRFYASNLLFLNYQSVGDFNRFKTVRWFLARRFDGQNVRFMREMGIRYVFIDKQAPYEINRDEIGGYGLTVAGENGRYLLLELKGSV